MYELLQEEQQRASARGETPAEVTMRFSASAERNQRRYNQPTVDEVAALFVGTDGAPPTNKDIVVYPRMEGKHRVSELHAFVDPMSYPLLFPTGTPLGWNTELLHCEDFRSEAQKRIRLTAMQFYSHQLMQREDGCILPHAGGRLFQQYCVDAYCKTEGQRLHWVRNNQKKLRSE